MFVQRDANLSEPVVAEIAVVTRCKNDRNLWKTIKVLKTLLSCSDYIKQFDIVLCP